MGSPCRNGVDDVIVISGILLLVAVVFLIIGLFGSLGWVYASIGVSVASFLFLLIGVRQRRDDVTDTATPATTGPAAVPTTAPTRDADAEVTLVPTGAPATPETVAETDSGSGTATAALAGGSALAAGGAAAAASRRSSGESATTALRRTPAKKSPSTTTSAAKKTASTTKKTAAKKTTSMAPSGSIAPAKK